ncbi:MAG: damage-inducible protein [Gimesia sp.]|jgi:PncC family amidohydrolase|uniref:Damage-inducible protein n=2 Tax=Gimesia maris TaxID=122 RepID=A0A3D3QZS1_9PLAN|nr:damage-inducible protein [Gimesia sp.]HCO22091.1 damage-inducible protein [Gimesia maris]|tara:strand:- start:370367 stop:370984 length:618 start_codon:yes stop_codon:yes gene_type:complete
MTCSVNYHESLEVCFLEIQMLPDFLMQAAIQVKSALVQRDEKLVLAESCTGGLAATLMTSLPGISEYFCGSAVVYRWDTKMKWLGVQRETLDEYTDVSLETAREMAVGVLRQTPEATLSASITGHLGPDAPIDQDGIICISLARSDTDETQTGAEWILAESYQCDDLLTSLDLNTQTDQELTLRQQRQLAAAHQFLNLIAATIEP